MQVSSFVILFFLICGFSNADADVTAVIKRAEAENGTVLDLNSFALHEKDAGEIAKRINGSKFKDLRMDFTGLEDPGLKEIVEVLPNTKLTFLSVAYNMIKNVDGLASKLKDTQLTSVNLEQNGIGNSGITAMFNGLEGSLVTELRLPAWTGGNAPDVEKKLKEIWYSVLKKYNKFRSLVIVEKGQLKFTGDKEQCQKFVDEISKKDSAYAAYFEWLIIHEKEFNRRARLNPEIKTAVNNTPMDVAKLKKIFAEAKNYKDFGDNVQVFFKELFSDSHKVLEHGRVTNFIMNVDEEFKKAFPENTQAKPHP